ncbi:MAG: Tm-1-like ATP-binding domain-containing protein, partial [Verrucomicrobia bacterium]|nr:Tm-1-like ATP-binding domain-containing protein [Verrucomicrobiota bacterium]
MPTIAVLGTFDTKGHEHAALAEMIRQRGFNTRLINVGTQSEPVITPDVSSSEVAAASHEDWQTIFARQDRGECVSLMARAAACYLAKQVETGSIQGVISLGGGGGTAIATAAMRALPIGFPKVMVSTLASGNVAHYVGTVDIVMVPAIVDVAGMNRISRTIFENAAGAIYGMVDAAEARRARPEADKPLVVASMFGNT